MRCLFLGLLGLFGCATTDPCASMVEPYRSQCYWQQRQNQQALGRQMILNGLNTMNQQPETRTNTQCRWVGNVWYCQEY